MSDFPSITVIHLTGELELSRRAEIRDALRLSGVESAVLVDFSEVTYADSTALSELLRFYSDSQKSKIPVAVLIKSKQFARVIEYAGLAEAFRIFEDRSEALVYLGATRQ
jgi:anti-anti-sigma factor